MKTIQKLLIFAIIVSLAVFTFACGGGDGAKPNQDAEQNGSANQTNETDGIGITDINENKNETDATEDSTPEKLMPDIPDDIKFDGYEFVMQVRGSGENAHWNVEKDFMAEEQNGDQMNDAVYNRNRKIEEQFGITISIVPSTSTTGTGAYIASLITAGDDNFDVFVPPMYQTATLITRGLLVNLNDVPYLDLDKPWWDQNINRDLSIGKKLYATIGDIAISTMNATSTFYFNKTLQANLELDDLYNIVRDGKWTLDKMNEMSRQALSDLNGDGVYDKDDQFGLIVQQTITFNYFFASGESATVNNSDGLPEPSVNNPRAVNVIGKIIDVLTPESGMFLDKNPNGDDSYGMFRDGRGLFYSHVLFSAGRLRAETTDFGILPMPKYNETQERYYSYADSWCTSLLCVPITNGNPERTGIILEALAAESMYTMVPVYYDINLSNQYFRDDESIEMLDIIKDSRVLSVDEFYSWGMTDEIRNIINKGDSGAIVSKIEAYMTKLEGKIGKTIETLESFEN